MECVVVFLLLVITFGLLAGYGWWRSPGDARRLTSLRAVAQRFHGTPVRTGWRGALRVAFTYRSASVIVELLARAPRDWGRVPAVRVRVPWPEAAWRVEICHPPRVPPRTWRGGLQPIRLTGNAFDRRYSIWGTDPPAVGTLLNEVVRAHLARLCSQPVISPLAVHIDRGTMMVTKLLDPRCGTELTSWVQAVLDLYDQALLTRTRDITFLDQQPPRVPERAVCQVCGEEIHQGLVFCSRCQTPHHHDCWLYVGHCSTFACGESEYCEPQAAPHPPAETDKRRSSD